MRRERNSTFITCNEIAVILGYSNGAAFMRDRRRLQLELDFPLPMPTCMRPLKWRRDAVEAWAEDQGLPLGERPSAPRPSAALMAEARRA